MSNQQPRACEHVSSRTMDPHTGPLLSPIPPGAVGGAALLVNASAAAVDLASRGMDMQPPPPPPDGAVMGGGGVYGASGGSAVEGGVSLVLQQEPAV